MHNIEKAIEYELESIDKRLEKGYGLSTGSLAVLRDLLVVRSYCEVKEALTGHEHEYKHHEEYEHKKEFTDKDAKDWVSHMRSSDGAAGGHWNWEQCMQVKKEHNLMCSDAEVYAVMNMLYSDYGHVFAKHNVNTIDMYVDMLKAWVHDEDAPKNKTMLYYEEVIDGE